MLPLARVLKARGHAVVFASSPGFAGVIDHAGFEFLPAGFRWDESRVEATVPDIRPIPLRDRMLWLSKTVFLDRSPKTMVPDLIRFLERRPPDVIVSNRFEIAGAIVSQQTGIPLAGVNISLRCPKAIDQAFYGAEIAALWRHFGLPPDPEMAWFGRWLELSLMPRSWVLPGFVKEPTEFFVRPDINDCSGDEGLPDWFSEFAGRPIVHATLGTVFNREPALLERIIEAFRAPGLNLILTIGRDADPARFGTLPRHIRIERYIPTSVLAPYIDVSISHGGYGSVMSVLAHGIPMVLLPLSADQPFIAAIAQEHGVAVPLPPGFLRANEDGLPGLVDPAAVDPSVLRALVMTALEDPGYRNAAASLAAAMAALPGPDFAAGLIERLARDKRPIDSDEPVSMGGQR